MGAHEGMRRVVEAGLLAAVVLAVLAFGGTAPQFFAITQGIVLLLGILQLVSGESSVKASPPFPIAIPFLLIALVFLQIAPLPAFLARTFGLTASYGHAHSYFTISAAPYETASGLLSLVTYITAFYLVLVLSEQQKARKHLVLVLLAVSVLEAFYGLIQYLTGWQQIFGYVKKFYLQDATGTYINRNHFAGLVEMILPFAVVFALKQFWTLRRRSLEEGSRGKEIFSSAEFPRLVFWVFVSAVLFAALASSHSRMGIIACLVSLITMLALAGTSSLSAKARVACGTLFFLSIVGLALWIGTDPIIRRFETVSGQYNRPGQDRLSIWRDSLRLIGRHPIVGSGLGTFAVVYPSVQTAFLNNLVDHAHCDYLEVATELGLPGAILVFGSIFWILGLTIRHCRSSHDEQEKPMSFACLGSITAILLHSLADFNLYIPANALVFAIILGLAWRGTNRSGLVG